MCGIYRPAETPQAMDEVSATTEKYTLAMPSEVTNKGAAMIDKCIVVFVSGLLLAAFKSPVSKASLRADVTQALNVLEKYGVDLTKLVPALKQRADLALECKIVV